MNSVFGRTNLNLSRRWVEAAPGFDEACACALAPGTVVCARANLPQVGHVTRARKDLLVAAFSGYELENAASATHADALASAVLVQALSCLGRGRLDFFFLQVRAPLQDHQLQGFFSAMEEARAHRLVRFVGLEVGANLPNVMVTSGFEILMAPAGDHWRSWADLAKTERLGLVGTGITVSKTAIDRAREHAVVLASSNAEDCAHWTGTAVTRREEE